MRTTHFKLPGILTAASAAGAILLSSCSSNGMMIYSSKKVGTRTQSKNGLFALTNKNGKPTTQTKTRSKSQVITFQNPGLSSAKAKRSTKAKTKTPQPKHMIYVIQKGDTLSHIALAHKVGINELASLNNMTTKDTILAGKTLRIPHDGIKPKTVKRATPKTSAVKYYTVKKGDILGRIALKSNVSVANLRKWNKLKNDNIHIGWKLALGPGGKAVAPPRPGGSRTRVLQPIPASGIHVVKSGDSISSIATRYEGLTSSKLKSINGLMNDRIIPGQALKLRGERVNPSPNGGGTRITNETPTLPGPEATSPGVPNPKGVPSTVLPHFVDQQSDTLKSVADMYGSKIEWILAKNPGIKTDADLRTMKEISVPVQQ